jgi:hypothetical protein
MGDVNAIAPMIPCSGAKCADAGDAEGNPTTEATPPFEDRLIADDAVAKLRALAGARAAGGAPFFLAAGFRKPHLPHRFPAPYALLYPPVENITLARFKTLGQSIPPISFWNNGPGTDNPSVPWPDAEAQQERLSYYSSISWVDTRIGALLDELEASGLAGSTVVAFAADHGWSLGEEGAWQKFTAWELGTRVPLMVRAPWLQGSAGLVSSEVAELVDLMPTLAELSGVPLPPGEQLDGQSLVPAMLAGGAGRAGGSSAASSRGYALSVYPRCPADTVNASNMWRDNDCLLVERSRFFAMAVSLRTGDYRYTEWLRWNGTSQQPLFGAEPLGVELYNHTLDTGQDFDASFEHDNMAESPAYAQLRAALAAQLRSAYSSRVHGGAKGWEKEAAVEEKRQEMPAEAAAGGREQQQQQQLQQRQQGPAPPKFKGYVYFTYQAGAYSSSQSTRSLAALAALGVDTVEIGVTYYVANSVNATLIQPIPGKSPSDSDVLKAIADAKSLGMQVALKPHIDCLDSVWRAEIGTGFTSEAQWADWFGNYTAFIAHFAQLGSASALALFNVGTELDGTELREAEWRQVVAAVRSELGPGVPLTYGCNWAFEGRPLQPPFAIQWWDAVDFIGIDAYYPLASRASADPSLAQLTAAWQPILTNLSALSAAWGGKRILFPEIGYASFLGAAADPPSCCSGEPALALQARLFQAFLQAVLPQPWFGGGFFWAWQVQDVDDSMCSTDFSIHRKPAEALVSAAYGGLLAEEEAAAAAAAAEALELPPSSQPLSIYADGASSPHWADWSWGAAVNLSCSAGAFPGHAASARVACSSYGALALRSEPPQPTSGFSSLQFDLILLNGSSSVDAAAWLCSCDNCSAGPPSCPVLPQLRLVDSLPASQQCSMATEWSSASSHFVLPLQALLTPQGSAQPVSSFARLQLGQSQPGPLLFLVDNIQLV